MRTAKTKVQLPRLYCRRCGYEWTPKIASPMRCARCRTPYWKTIPAREQVHAGGHDHEEVAAHD